jgi:peptide/nickel transport system ATP-binding protein
MNAAPLLRIRDLRVHYTRKHVSVRAVDGVDMDIARGRTLGLVGESGCGKSTLGKAVVRLIKPTTGEIEFDGCDLAQLDERGLRPWRPRIQMIFQDPYSSLNPRIDVHDWVSEPLRIHSRGTRPERAARVRDLLDRVGIPRAVEHRYPAQLSGGQRQRVGIARALALDPDLLVADEPTSALDVSIQAQVVNLLRDLQKQLGLSYLFISHDLRVVELISHKVAVMYLGKIVEMGLAGRIANKASHPYTHILWASLVEKLNKESSHSSAQAGRWGVFDFERPVSGCRFAPRCPVYESKGKPTICTDPATEPKLADIGGHYVACHFPL